MIGSQLGSRKIDELIDLPLMTSPDILDTLDVLSEILGASTLLRPSSFAGW